MLKDPQEALLACAKCEDSSVLQDSASLGNTNRVSAMRAPMLGSQLDLHTLGRH